MHTARAAVLELLEVELKPCCLVKAQRNARSPVRVVVFSGWITDGQSTFQPRRAQTPSQLDVDAVDVHVRVAARAGPRLGVRRRRVAARPPRRSDVSAVQFDVDRRPGRHGAGHLLPPVAGHGDVVVVVHVVVVPRRRPLAAAMVLVDHWPGAVPVVAAVFGSVAGRRPADVVAGAARSSVPDRITVGRVGGGGARRRRRGGDAARRRLTFDGARRAARGRPQQRRSGHLRAGNHHHRRRRRGRRRGRRRRHLRRVDGGRGGAGRRRLRRRGHRSGLRRLGGGGGGSGRVRRPPVRLEELGQVLARLLELVLVQDNVEHLLSPGHTSSHCFTSVLRQFSTISVLSLNVKSKPHLYSTLL